MTWTFTNLVIEIIAGAVGGCAIAAAAKEYNFGILGHIVTGALGGAFSGYFLQSIAAGVVDSTGEIHEASDQLTQWFVKHSRPGRWRDPHHGRGIAKHAHRTTPARKRLNRCSPRANQLT